MVIEKTYILQENQNPQSRQIQNKFVHFYLTRVELGDQRKLLHNLDVTLIQIQHTYTNNFTSLERPGNMFLSLTDINAREASLRTGITCIQTDVDKIFTYLEMLATHIVS